MSDGITRRNRRSTTTDSSGERGLELSRRGASAGTRSPHSSRHRHVAGSPTSPRGSLWTRWRATTRLAVRQVVRTPGSSLLVVSLIALPITALTGGLIFFESHQATPAQQAQYQLGQADSRISIVAGANESNRQSLLDGWMSSDGTTPDGAQPEGLPSVVPSTAKTVEVSEGISALLPTADGATQFTTVEGPVWEKRFSGAFDLATGTAPSEPDEALATAGTLDRLGLDVGDSITTTAPAGGTSVTVTITGTVESVQPALMNGGFVVPPGSPLIDETYGSSWYVFGWQPSLSELTEMNQLGYVAYARDLMINPPPYPDAPAQSDGNRANTYMLGLVGGVFFAVLVALIAGAAMSVSARRQQRSLAMAASVGAGRGSLFAIVLGQGIVLGLIAAIVGVALGAAIAGGFMAVVDNGNPWSMRGNWGFHMPLAPILAIAALAVIVGAVSAVFPARTATNGDTLAALRGARRPVNLRRSMPRWGVGVLIAGLAASVAAIVVLIATDNEKTGRTELQAVVAVVLVIVGPLLLILGTALCGHWLLSVLARASAHAGVATRLAVRDLAANPSRTVPAFLAIATAMLVATTALSMTASSSAASARQYGWSAPLNSVVFSMWGDTDNVINAGVRRAETLAKSVDPRAVVITETSRPADIDPETQTPRNPDQVVANYGWPMGEESCRTVSCVDGWIPNNGPLTVISTKDLPAAVGTTLTATQRAAYESGTAIISASYRDGITTGPTSPDQIPIFHIPVAELLGDGTASGTTPWSAEVTTDEVPYLALEGLRTSSSVIISPQTAADLGIKHVPNTVIAQLDRPLTTAESDRIVAGAADSGEASIYAAQERGPDSGLQWLTIIAGITMALVIGTAVVTLGLARFERRPDDATLTAIGGKSSLRRRVNAVQAVAVVGLGSVIGAAIGLIPTIAFVSASAAYFRISDLPWMWIGGLAIALPLVLATIAWLVKPRTPDLVRRTAIT